MGIVVVLCKLAVKNIFFSRSARGSPVAACQKTGLLHQRGSMWSLFTKTLEHTFYTAKTTSWCNRYSCTFSLCDQLLYAAKQWASSFLHNPSEPV